MAPATGTGKESASARVLGSATAGVLELFTFHPVDTIAKRLMTNKEKARDMGTLNKVIFRDAANAGTLQKYMSLFPGIGFAFGYKVLQRVYKFGGQPSVNDYLNTNHKSLFVSAFGEKGYKPWMQATAGSLVGIGEIVLLPLDVLKIIMQTNPAAMQGKSIVGEFFGKGVFNLYKGAGWTAARNAPGSFALFGGNAAVKEYVFGLKDYRKATFFQNFCGSIGGSVASLIVSAPFDVVKTRIQMVATTGSSVSGFRVVRDMVAKEGFGSFFKGLVPKILVVGPKLVFSFTIAQQAIPFFSKLLGDDVETTKVAA
ncbi:mitochondrial carrier [Gonapodya prolifera JEL478]|uniref:Mitochondrial carrier n=1 Tax=Gonapodya prolifera (strain JEL478) TaxID=1344416 RepID=A0A139ANP4_GONPJ|nr:mitochondrial carrier [Gonapodya prolifera JEL478]|eukprot:KXS18115.1 mitochondrial carrier [Gonapodya prolifera JEL478]